MSESWVSAKPQSKRGVNKANMDEPQPEFIDDTASSEENSLPEEAKPEQQQKSERPRSVEP